MVSAQALLTMLGWVCGVCGVLFLINALGRAEEAVESADGSASLLGCSGLILLITCVMLVWLR